MVMQVNKMYSNICIIIINHKSYKYLLELFVCQHVMRSLSDIRE